MYQHLELLALLACGGWVQSGVESKPKVTENFVYVKIDDAYELVLEPALKESAKALKLAYATPGLSAARRLMPRQLTGKISKVLGKKESVADTHATAEKIAQFFDDFGYSWDDASKHWVPHDEKTGKTMRAFGIDPEEWLVPDDGFASYNDFFIKHLKRGVRPVDPGNDAVVAPADSKLTVVPNLSTKPGQSTFFKVKSKKFSLETFLKDKDLAKEFDGGTLLIFRLSPYNYHRFHFPLACKPSQPTKIDGGFESVDPIAYKTQVNPLIINKRHVVTLKTDIGGVLMVIVGAFGVGTIVETFKPGARYQKGDEAGYFQFGGSTVALVFKKGVLTPDGPFVEHSLEGYETAVKMGERIGEVQPVAVAKAVAQPQRSQAITVTI